MAQIRKLQTGGTVFTSISGEKFTLEEARQALESNKATLPANQRSFQNAALRAINEGYTVVQNPDYTLSFFDNNNQLVPQELFISTGVKPSDSRVRRIFDATVNNQRDADRYSATALTKITKAPKPAPQEEKKELSGLKGSFIYDKNNSSIFEEENYNNLNNLNALNNIRAFLSLEDAEQKKYKNYGKYSGLITAYNTLISNKMKSSGISKEDAENDFWNSLMNGIKTNTVTSSQASFLKEMGIGDLEGGEGGDEGEEYKIPEDWTGNKEYIGTGDIPLYIYKDTNGNYYVGDESDDYWKHSRFLRGDVAFEGTPFESGFIYQRNDGKWGLIKPEDAYTIAQAGKSPQLTSWYRAFQNDDLKDIIQGIRASGIGFNPNLLTEDDEYGGYSSSEGKYYQDYPNLFQKFNESDTPTYYRAFKDNNTGKTWFEIISRPGSQGSWFNYSYLDPSELQTFSEQEAQQQNLLNPLNSTVSLNVSNLFRAADNKKYALVYTVDIDGIGKQSILRDMNGEYYLARGENVETMIPKKIYNQEFIEFLLEHPKETLNWFNQSKFKNFWGKWRGPNMSDLETLLMNGPRKKDTSYTTTGLPGSSPARWIPKTKEEYIKDVLGTKAYAAGGTFTSKSKENVATLEDVEMEFSKSHDLLGAQGLTSAEKTQLTAAVADIAGIALTAVPEIATNVIGAGTGIAASVAKYSAIKDRTGKGNIGSLLVDLGLDAVSLVPVLGAISKGVKVGRGIIAAGDIIAKVLAPIGAVSGIAALNRCISTGKVTTEDATAILQGLSAAGIGVKSAQKSLGKSKLAAESSVKAASSPTAKEYTTSKELIIDGKSTGIKKSSKEIDALIKKHKGNSKEIIQEVKQELADAGIAEVSDEQVKTALHTINPFKTSEGKFKITHPISSFKPSNRPRTWKSSEAPADQTHNTLYYLTRPWKRRAAFEDNLKNYSGEDIKDIISKMTHNKRITLAERELLNQTAWHPERFEGVSFKNKGVKWGEGFWRGWGLFYREPKRIVKAKSVRNAPTTPTTPTSNMPVYQEDIIPSKEGFPILPLSSALKWRNAYTAPETTATYGISPELVSIAFNKEGGKIIKHKQPSGTLGWRGETLNKFITNPSLSIYATKIRTLEELDEEKAKQNNASSEDSSQNTTPSATGTAPSATDTTTGTTDNTPDVASAAPSAKDTATDTTGNANNPADATNNPVGATPPTKDYDGLTDEQKKFLFYNGYYEQDGKKYYYDPKSKTFTENKPGKSFWQNVYNFFNPSEDLNPEGPIEVNKAAFLDFGRMFGNIWGLDKAFDSYKKSIALKGLVHEDAPIIPRRNYNLSNFLRQREEVKLPFSLEVPTTDTREAATFNLLKADKINEALRKIDSGMSDYISNVDLYNLSVDEKQNILNADKAYKNIARANEVESMLAAADASKRETMFAQIINPYLTQLSSDYKKDLSDKQRLLQTKQLNELDDRYNDLFDNDVDLADIKQEWSEKVKNGKTTAAFKDYVFATNRALYDKVMDKLKKAKEKEQWDILENTPTGSGWFIRQLPTSLKRRGGTLSSKDKMDPLAHIAVELNRSALRAVQKSRDDLNKRLLLLLQK